MNKAVLFIFGILLLSGLIPLFAWGQTPEDAGPSPRDMVLIPAGTFLMGATEEDILWAAQTFHSESLDYYQDETPQHPVRLDDYYIDRSEVTVGAFKDYLAATGGEKPRYFDNEKFNTTEQPVVGVSWKQAHDYCQWAGKRLPTEAEWEKAARGKDGRPYPWGKNPEPERGNFRGTQDGQRYTTGVGFYPEGKSPYGVLDLAGNVWEWTDTWYGPHPGNDMESDLFGEKFKVMKGGSWFSNMDLARITVRGKALPTQKMNYIGFRCAWSKGPKAPDTNRNLE